VVFVGGGKEKEAEEVEDESEVCEVDAVVSPEEEVEDESEVCEVDAVVGSPRKIYPTPDTITTMAITATSKTFDTAVLLFPQLFVQVGY